MSVILVTGSSTGIGQETALHMARKGHDVYAAVRSPETATELKDLIAAEDLPVSVIKLDLVDPDSIVTAVAEIMARSGRIDALVNNAGGQFMSPLESISAKGWEAVLNTNLTGGFLMARECYRQWMAQHGGSIVNIVADMWGSMPGMGHSGAARAGMVSLTETAALEWAHSGVRVNAVAPGYIASSGMDNYPPEAGDMLRAMPRTVPLGRFGNEAEVSAAITFLLSPAASFISGTTLRVDGARPQVRMGWPQRPPGATAAAHPAVRPFDGFHRAQVPQVFAPSHTPKTEAA